MADSPPLRLLAEDAADLELISAAMQDALVKVGDMAYEPKKRRFTAVVNRFRWENARRGGPNERIRCALAFENVLSVRSSKLKRDQKDAIAAILALQFAPASEPPGGEVVVLLAGGGGISLSVEALEASLTDLGAPWRTPNRPDHERG